MLILPSECPRCRGALEPGFVTDRTQHGSPTEQEWVEGKLETSFWTGIKTEGRDRYAVRTLRCERCGYLESYATHLLSKPDE